MPSGKKNRGMIIIRRIITIIIINIVYNKVRLGDEVLLLLLLFSLESFCDPSDIDGDAGPLDGIDKEGTMTD